MAPNRPRAEDLQKQIGVIADDLTGAMDTGGQFALSGLSTVLRLTNEVAPSATVEVINTGSRELPEDQARQRVAAAASALQGRSLYKKLDSTLRGHLGAEIEAVLGVTDLTKAVICPAVIEEERYVIDGELWINGQRLHVTAFANDPAWPSTSSHISDKLPLSTVNLPLSVVRSGSDALAEVIKSVHAQYIIADATSKADLAIIASAIISANALPCGALSLAHAWVVALTGRDTSAAVEADALAGPLIVVAGSHHPATREQARRLSRSHSVTAITVRPNRPRDLEQGWRKAIEALSAGESVLLRTPGHDVSPSDQAGLLDALSALAKRITDAYPVGGIVVCGGATAGRLLDALAIEAIVLRGEYHPGFPSGILQGGAGHGLPIFTKAGGFGPPDALQNLFQQLTAQR